MKIASIFHSFYTNPLARQIPAYFQSLMFLSTSHRPFSTDFSDDPELKDFMKYMDGLKNYEKSGVPKGAGTDSDDGFDLGRMKRLLQLLGNPQSQFKAIHIAGTKGKGSTAAFLSGILRAEGYSVGCYTSPHMQTIRERITLGRSGQPVSAKALNCLFQRVRVDLERAIKLEKGCVSHFEVFIALAFSMFGQDKVDVAVVEAGLGGARDATNVISSSELALSIITTIGEEHLAALGGSLESIAVAKSGIIKDGRPLVLGGPFLPRIEHILRDKASSMSSPVVSASDPGNRSILKGFSKPCQMPYQLSDILRRIERDLSLFIELFDVKLHMLGPYQLQNAATATCAALCLRHQGWRLSDISIRAGLESTFLFGRSQFLTSKEAEMLGVHGATILLDGVGLVEAVLFAEIGIAGGRSRSTSASLLKDSWIQASKETSNDIRDCGSVESELFKDQLAHSERKMEDRAILFAEGSLDCLIRVGHDILRAKSEEFGIIVFTGSLHIVAAVLGSLEG